MKYDFKCKKKLDLTIIFALEGSRLQFEKNVYNSLGWQMQYKMDHTVYFYGYSWLFVLNKTWKIANEVVPSMILATFSQ